MVHVVAHIIFRIRRIAARQRDAVALIELSERPAQTATRLRMQGSGLLEEVVVVLRPPCRRHDDSVSLRQFRHRRAVDAYEISRRLLCGAVTELLHDLQLYPVKIEGGRELFESRKLGLAARVPAEFEHDRQLQAGAAPWLIWKPTPQLAWREDAFGVDFARLQAQTMKAKQAQHFYLLCGATALDVNQITQRLHDRPGDRSRQLENHKEPYPERLRAPDTRRSTWGAGLLLIRQYFCTCRALFANASETRAFPEFTVEGGRACGVFHSGHRRDPGVVDGMPISVDGNETTAPLLIQRDGAVETLLINDAPRNRMGLDFMDALETELARVATDASVRAIVVRGAGTENFSVGMDLKQLPLGIERRGSIEAVLDQRLRVLDAIESLPKPVIAVLTGYCLGGGLELPLACHFRFAATEGCKIGLPELDLGTVPAWGGSARLTRCVGRAHTLDMILRAKKISGPEALRIGLVHEVWPVAELFDRAHALARELAEMPAIAVAEMLRCVVGVGDQPLAAGIAAERQAVLATIGTPDQSEGMYAFLEKRRPRFNQRKT